MQEVLFAETLLLGFSSPPRAPTAESTPSSISSLARPSLSPSQIRLPTTATAMALRLLLLLAVAAATLLAADARPCHTFLVSFPADPSNPGGDGAVHHRHVPRVASVVTVFRVRRLGPHHHRNHYHLHSIPANVQIRRPELPHPSAAADAGAQERARDILVVVVGLLFGVACGALTAASLYLVWYVLAGATASSPYDELYGDEDEEASDTESPKKVGYVIIQELEAHDGGKN